MSKFKYNGSEQEFNNVLKYQEELLETIERPYMTKGEQIIIES